MSPVPLAEDNLMLARQYWHAAISRFHVRC